MSSVSVLSVMSDEWRRLLSNRSALLVFIGGLLVYSWLYPLPYQHQVATDLPIAVVDGDHSQASRTLVRYLDATPEVSVAARPESQHAAEQLLRQGEVSGLLLIPLHFETDLRRGTQSDLAFAGDGSYFLVQGKLETALSKVVLTLSSEFALANLLAQSDSSDTSVQLMVAQAAPLQLELQPLFNESLGYSSYVMPAVFAFMLQQLLLLGTMLLGSMSPERHDSSALARLTCRSVLLLVLYLLGAGYLLGPAQMAAGVVHHGQLNDVLWVLVPYLLASITLGNALGSLLPHPAYAAPLALFSSMPILFASGAIWPAEAIPVLLKHMMDLVPALHGIPALVKLGPMGAERAAVVGHAQALWLLAAVYGLLAWWCLARKQLV